MKHALRLLSRFFLMSLFLMLVLSSLVVLYRYVSGYDPGQASADIVTGFFGAMRDTAVTSIIVAATIALFAILRATDRPFVPLVALGIAWTVALVVIATLWVPADSPGMTRVPVIPQARVVRFPGTALFVQDVVGNSGTIAVIHRSDRRPPGSEVFAEIVRDPVRGELIVPGRSDLTLDLGAITGSYPEMVSPPARVGPLVRDLQSVNRIMLGSGETGDRNGLLPIIAFGVFLFSCWTVARLTRWPLFNAVLVFLCVRGVLWLLHSLYFEELGGLLMSAIGSSQTDLVAAGIVAFVAGVLLVALFLLPPLTTWKRELIDG